MLDPNRTPPPVLPDAATRTAERYAGVRPMAAGGPLGPATGGHLYLVTGTDAVALVDDSSGGVAAVVRPSRLPDDTGLEKSGPEAEAAARAYLTDLGVEATGPAAVNVVSVAGASAYRVDFEAAGGSKPRVVVNGSTGAVIAFVDATGAVGDQIPVVGGKRAQALAIAAAGIDGETVTSAEFEFDGLRWVWDIGLGVPSAADPEVFEHGAFVKVDAASGEVTFVKDAR